MRIISRFVTTMALAAAFLGGGSSIAQAHGLGDSASTLPATACTRDYNPVRSVETGEIYGNLCSGKVAKGDDAHFINLHD